MPQTAHPLPPLHTASESTPNHAPPSPASTAVAHELVDKDTSDGFDVEASSPWLTVVTVKDNDDDKEASVVSWDGPDDPANPRNWPKWKKWVITSMVGLITIIAPMGSSIIAPAIPAISQTLGITNTVEGQMIISIFVIAFAFGPLFIAPLSEVYGRAMGRFAIHRTVSRLQRGMQYIANLKSVTLLSIPRRTGRKFPVGVGPSSSPASSFFVRHTAQPSSHAKRDSSASQATTPAPPTHTSLAHKLSESVRRPFVLLLTQPIVQTVALYMAYIYGLLYLVLATFTKLWISRYHQPVAISGLHYIALGVGLVAGSMGSAPVFNHIYRTLRDRNNGTSLPEHRLPAAIPAAVVLPAALLLYGWSAQSQTHWILPDLGIALFGLCFCVPFMVIQIYLVDSYRRYSASAMAAATFLRSVFGFGFPLFAGGMYERLEYGWGNSVLALVAVVGIPAPLLVYWFGARLRAKSTYAAG
ncbi:MFS multidrug transporter [Zopfochytrium polystomum]|nr:MFS multidrug transporter [Zopfochytrium polystomum]